MRINLPNSRTFSKIFKKAIGADIVENINGITTDSREIQKGDLYVAIKGENVDGNIFLNDVFKKGALCAIVSELMPNANVDQIEVSDTIKAIGKVATELRSQFDIPLIGITGTNGKTSTK